MAKKILLSILALVLVACVILSALLIFGVAKIGQTMIAPTATVFYQPAATSSTDEQMDEIQSQVMSYRGLELKTPLKRALLTQSELEDKVTNDFFKDYTDEDAQKDTEILSALGLLAPDFDLHQFYLDLYSEQVAGYYDDETKEMFVISGEDFGGTERMTYAHEFTHALQDQTYDLENGLNLNDDNCQEDTEYCAAVTALIEGDATLSESYWYMKYSTDQDKQQISQFQQSYVSPIYDSAPAYMKADFLFPYNQGYEFVNYLYGNGMWNAIDAAYQNPPVSTEQILHPEKYPTDKPITVTVPDMLPTLGSGWQEDDRNVMGEWYTYLILADGRDSSFRLPDEDAKDASTGWGGDTYVYYSNPESGQFVFVWVTRWDSNNDSDQFFQASQTYGNDRWGDPQTSTTQDISWNSTDDGMVLIQQSGRNVLWLMTPTKQIQQSVMNALNFEE